MHLKPVVLASLIFLGTTLVLTGCFPRLPNPQATPQQQEAALDPSFSPDGTRILFSSNHDGDLEIYVVNANGTDLHMLTNNDKQDFYPSWSPDGASIAFSSDAANPPPPLQTRATPCKTFANPCQSFANTMIPNKRPLVFIRSTMVLEKSRQEGVIFEGGGSLLGT